MPARLNALNTLLRLGLKPMLEAMHRPELTAAQAAELLSYLGQKPRGVREEQLSVDGPAGKITLRSFRSKEADDGKAVLFIHGGGYVACDTRLYRGLLGQIALRSGLMVLAPDYRLAPTHPFPAAFEDVSAVWADLVNNMGFAPDKIILAGDSAGGGLVLSLLSSLLSDGVCPAGVVVYSPWTDLTLSGASFAENADKDVIFPASKAPALVDTVALGADRADPRLSPLFADFPSPPPVFISVSESELLRDDSMRIAEKLRRAGGDVTMEIAPDAPHVLPLFFDVLNEADALLSQSTEFMKGLIADGSD